MKASIILQHISYRYKKVKYDKLVSLIFHFNFKIQIRNPRFQARAGRKEIELSGQAASPSEMDSAEGWLCKDEYADVATEKKWSWWRGGCS
jgi:hypothetical protein